MWGKRGTAGQATDVTIWRMRFKCWIPKATDTHSEYVIVTAFRQHQWIGERASMLPHLYIACPVIYGLSFHASTGMLPKVGHDSSFPHNFNSLCSSYPTSLHYMLSATHSLDIYTRGI